jgi:hypothetical protein
VRDDVGISVLFLCLSATSNLALVASTAVMWLLVPIGVAAGPIGFLTLVGELPDLASVLLVSAMGLCALLPAVAQVLDPGRPTFRWIALPLCVLPAVYLLWAFVPGLFFPLFAEHVFPGGRVFPVGL